MKAVWYDKQGPAREVFNYGDLPTPEAGPGEVRIKLEAAGVNPSDTYRRAGTVDPMEYPQFALKETVEAHLAVEVGTKLGTVIIVCAR